MGMALFSALGLGAFGYWIWGKDTSTEIGEETKSWLQNVTPYALGGGLLAGVGSIFYFACPSKRIAPQSHKRVRGPSFNVAKPSSWSKKWIIGIVLVAILLLLF